MDWLEGKCVAKVFLLSPFIRPTCLERTTGAEGTAGRLQVCTLGFVGSHPPLNSENPGVGRRQGPAIFFFVSVSQAQ